MKKEGRKGQVTLFIILGIIMVVLAILIYLFFPQIKGGFVVQEINPNLYIQTCIEEEILNSVEMLSIQGGSLNPEHYILYKEEKIEYLCYTEENYRTCVMQQPMLKKHIEEELENDLSSKASECFDSLEESFEKSGYDVNLKKGPMSIELLPGKIEMKFNNSLTLKKESAKKYDNMKVSVKNNIYELVNVAMSILNWEARYGDAETTTYMNYYKDLKVEKLKQSDGSTIYILTERDSGNKFQFASRSVVWPPGFG